MRHFRICATLAIINNIIISQKYRKDEYLPRTKEDFPYPQEQRKTSDIIFYKQDNVRTLGVLMHYNIYMSRLKNFTTVYLLVHPYLYYVTITALLF